VIRSILRIAAEQYRGRGGNDLDWRTISNPPKILRKLVDKTDRRLLDPFPLSDEEYWLALAHFASKKHEQTRVMVARLMNTLLGLGQVRPWVTWHKATRSSDRRPEIAYCGRSLLSNLALQLCLRVARVDAFVICTHCQKQYLPAQRAPKAGQRNFCPGCRKRGISNKYALQDFRERRRRPADDQKQ